MTARKLWQHLRLDRAGAAAVEFALGVPLLLTAGLWGAEMANYALVNMKVNQLAVHLADNASRVGDTSTLKDRKVYEFDINDVLYGAQIQGGSLNIFSNGRVIISSLQRRTVGSSGATEQYIHWQRCRGTKALQSAYGREGQAVGAGMGPSGQEVFAQADEAVIFVEFYYTYQPMVSSRFITNPDIMVSSAFTVRDARDLAGLYQRDPGSPDPVQTCTAFRGPMTISSTGKITA